MKINKKEICEKYFRGNRNRMRFVICFAISFVLLALQQIFTGTTYNSALLLCSFLLLVIEYKNCMDACKNYEEEQERTGREAAARENALQRAKKLHPPKKRKPDKTECCFEVTVKEVKGPKPIKEAALDFMKNKKDPKNKPSGPSGNKPSGQNNPTGQGKPTPIVKPGESKAEKEGNVIIGKDGKPVVKPNYKMIASEWVSENLNLLNKICNDAFAISGGSGTYSATIPKSMLPDEQATWVVIGKTLEAEDEIDSFKIVKEGINITVN